MCKAVGLIAAFHLIVLGCNVVERPTPPQVIEPSPEAGVWTTSSHAGDGTAVIGRIATYDGEGRQRIDDVAGMKAVWDLVASMDGYRYDPLSSISIEVRGVPEGSPETTVLEIVVLGLADRVDPSRSAAYVAFVSSPGYGWFIEPSILSFVEESPENGFEPIDSKPGLWLKTGERMCGIYDQSVAAGMSDSSYRIFLQAIKWKKFFKCVMDKFVPGCGTVVVTCIAAGPAYVKCVAIGCGAVLINAIFECWGGGGKS